MNTIQEVQDAVDDIVARLLEKGITEPEAIASIKSGVSPSVHLRANYETNPFDGRDYKFLYSNDLAGSFKAARDYIATLPSPEETVTRTYLSKVADAVDYARENSIAEEYVAPLRGVSMAMTENLLTHEAAE